MYGPNARKKKIGYEVHQSKGMINYPAVLLGRLGVDKRYQHEHLSAQIIDLLDTRLMYRDLILLKRKSKRS